MSTVTGARCVTCGAALTGPYCAQCGEAAHAHDYSLKHFVAELIESVTHADGRLFASFRALLARPGLLTADFLAGRRKPQMGPVQLFLVCNVIEFLIQPFSLFAPFTTTLGIHTSGTYWWTDMAKTMTAARVAARQTTIEQYTRAFDDTAHLQGKTLLIIMVPLFAVGAWALYGRVRRCYGEHLVFAFYTYAFMVLWIGVSTVVASQLTLLLAHRGYFHINGEMLDDVVSLASFLVLGVYLFLSARRVYAGAWIADAVKAVLLVGWMYAVLVAYKFSLFFTTFYAT